VLDQDFDAYNTASRMIGFNSDEAARKSEDYWSDKRIEFDIEGKKRRMLREYKLAFTFGDAADKKEARNGLREWNKTHPQEGVDQKYIRRLLKAFRIKMNEE